MEITEVKNILGITTIKHDTYLNTVVPLFEEYAKDYCNQTFEDGTGAVVLPGGVKVFIAKACEHNMGQAGLKSRSMGEVSYSYDTDFPPSIIKPLKTYRRLSFT